MEDIVTRFFNDLIERLTGPLTFRLFLQPAMAIFLATRDGITDARDGRPPHLWRMITGDAQAKARRWRETWQAVLKVFVLAVVLDCVYQWIVIRWVYPGEAMFTAVILAIVPYVLLRGWINRLARPRIGPKAGAHR